MKLTQAEERDWKREVSDLVDGLLAEPAKAEFVKRKVLGFSGAQIAEYKPSLYASDEDQEDMWENLPV